MVIMTGLNMEVLETKRQDSDEAALGYLNYGEMESCVAKIECRSGFK